MSLQVSRFSIVCISFLQPLKARSFFVSPSTSGRTRKGYPVAGFKTVHVDVARDLDIPNTTHVFDEYCIAERKLSVSCDYKRTCSSTLTKHC